MPSRTQTLDLSAMLTELNKRISSLEDAAKVRMLPPDYEWTVSVSGELIVRRLSDGAQQVVAF